MEGFTWLKVSAIAALFLGSLYVLAPTALQGDIEAQREAAARAVKTPGGDKKGADLEVRFDTPEPGPAADVLRARLAAAGVAVDRVSARDGQVVVALKPGTSRADVVALAGPVGDVKLYDPRAIAPVPGELPALADAPALEPAVWAAVQGAAPIDSAHWGSVMPGWALGPVPPGVEPLPLVVSGVSAGVATVGGLMPEGAPFSVVAVDGRMVALGVPAGPALDGVGMAQTLLPLGKRVQTAEGPATFLADHRAVSLIGSGPLPAPLTEVPAVAAGPEDQGPEVQAEESAVPAWLLAMLPDTEIQRGLDLQGGLDITLQVELDDAVLAQVGRDAQGFQEAAAKANLAVTSVKRDKFEPLIWFEFDDLQKLQDFLRETNPDYVYSTSEGGKHAFALRDDRIDALGKQAVEQVLETLRKRVDATGVKEPSIVKKGGGRINVQLPGAVDIQQAIDAIGTTAVLEFRMVDPAFSSKLVDDLVDAASKALPPDQFADDQLVNEWLWETKRLPEDRIILWHYEETAEGMTRQTYAADGDGPLPLVNEVVLTGNDVSEATVAFDSNNLPRVALNFKPRGGQIFCDLTTAHVGERFAIILDGQIRSAPGIRERICGNRASIEMGNSMNALQDANTLALVLRTGSLDAPVSIGEVRQVGAQLGRDAIQSGTRAAGLGGFIVVAFMAIWYRRAGWLANVALLLNVMMVLASLALFGATLTLPGIAGIALTMGMAVDANIIVFERIKEEIRLGVAPRKAVDTGFDKALSAVMDSNITTAIAGIVLFSYGSGPIKGFAVTLLIGIVTTLVTTIFVTRTLMELVTRSSTARITI